MRSDIEPDLFDHSVPFDNITPIYLINMPWKVGLGSVLLSSRPGLGLEDPRGHFTKVLALALALDDKVLALALASREKSWPCQGQGQDFFSKPQATRLLYVLCSAHTHSVT